MENIQTGQIVKIRNRHWRIESIYENELIASSIDSINNKEKKFYIPFENIESVGRDAPDLNRIGSLDKQLLYTKAYKMSLIHGTSPLMSMQLSTVIPTNYQLVPVIMALNSPRVRLLIADDVGLGKTIEAGLILNELIARNMIRRILIITPASLRDQWQESIRNLFKLKFRIISSLHRKYLEKELPVGASPWEYFNTLITSIDYAKAKIHRNELLDHKWDMVIVDEAHLAARPHQASDNSRTTLRWELLERISKKTKHMLLLTATPHNGYSDSFASLIEVLNNKAVNPTNKKQINRQIAANHVCQRTRNDVLQWLKTEDSDYNPFPEETDKKMVNIDTLSVNEEKTFKKFNNYYTHIKERAHIDLNQSYLVYFTLLHFMKRALSSPQALKQSLYNRIDKLKNRQQAKEIKDREAKSIITESDNLEKISTDEAGKRLERTIFQNEVTEIELELLEEILDIAKKITTRSDSKYKKLKSETVPELLEYSPKIIIFTRYKDTLSYLENNLQNYFSNLEIVTIYGDMNDEQRKEAFEEFDLADKSILIATDCISEGMNLQYMCSQVVHYELPWNPNRMEQRNGRVDRFGQPEDVVHIRTMRVERTLDDKILKHIIEKADKMKQDFGFSPPFFNDENQILKQLSTFGKLPTTRKPLYNDKQLNLFKDKQEESEDKSYDSQVSEKMKQINTESFYGQTSISLPDIEKKIRETEKTIGSSQEIEFFVKSALDLYNCTLKKKNRKAYNININDHRLNGAGIDNKIQNVTFDKIYAAKHNSAELIDLSHPLVNRLIQLIKQQSINSELYGRTAYKGSNNIENTIAVMKILVRYVVETEPNSIVEKMMTIGFDIYNKTIIPANKSQKFEKSAPVPCQRTDEEVREDLQESFADEFWEEHLKNKIDGHQSQLINEREKLIKHLDYEDNPPDWMKGITDIKFARYDILTITIGYPV